MKALISMTIVLIVAVLASSAAIADYPACTITQNTTWSTSRTLSSTVVVCGATLTISSGVTVTLKDGISIIILDTPGADGKIIVNGGILPANKVRFQSEDSDPWGCLIIDNQSTPAGNRITNAIFDNGGYCNDLGNYTWGMVSLMDGDLLLQYSELKNAEWRLGQPNNGLALFVSEDSDLTLEWSSIHDNEHVGIAVSNNSGAEIKNCNIYNNPVGLYFDNASSSIKSSWVHDNDFIGILVHDGSSLSVSGTTVEYNASLGYEDYYAGIRFDDGIAAGNSFNDASKKNTIRYNGNSEYGDYDVVMLDQDTSVDFQNVNWPDDPNPPYPQPPDNFYDPYGNILY